MFWNNPYFADDLTRINRQMEPQYAMAPQHWNNLGDEDKQRRQAEGLSYAFLKFFIYQEHPLLPSYTINRREGNIDTRFYMIDFKRVHFIECDKIKRDNHPLNTKRLQLTIEARTDLRNKISGYYGRPAAEDEILED